MKQAIAVGKGACMRGPLRATRARPVRAGERRSTATSGACALR